MFNDDDGLSTGCLKRVLAVFVPVMLLLAFPTFCTRFCARTVTDTSFHKVSTGPWTVNRIRLGMSQDDCRRVLGEPWRTSIFASTSTSWQWHQPTDITITFDTTVPARAREILGDTLTDLESNEVVGSSASEDDVKAILKNAKMQKQYRPKGSGVIAIGRTHIGTTYTCTDRDGTYCVAFYEGRLSYIRAQR